MTQEAHHFYCGSLALPGQRGWHPDPVGATKDRDRWGPASEAPNRLQRYIAVELPGFIFFPLTSLAFAVPMTLILAVQDLSGRKLLALFLFFEIGFSLFMAFLGHRNNWNEKRRERRIYYI